MTGAGLRPRDALWRLRTRESGLCDGIAVLLCVLVLARAAWLTADLSWPAGTDQLRDIAFAESFARGEWMSDPFFVGEWLWYPPLVPWLVGAASAVAGVPASMADVRLGPYINVLSPLAFYALVSMWIGRRAALASLVAFLFLDRGPYWLEPTYSPWLLAGPATQAVFYAGLMALTRAHRTPTRLNWAMAGVALGLAAMGHSAPALVLGVLAAATAGTEAFTTFRPVRAAGHLLIAGSVAAAVCSPLLASIAGHYGLHIRNPAGLLWTDPAVEGSAWSLLTSTTWALPLTVVAAVGMVSRSAKHEGEARPGRWLLIGWLAVSLALFATHRHEVATVRAGNPTGLPVFSPPHHFLFYFRAGLLVAFGAGCAALVSHAARLAGRWPPVRGRTRAGSQVAFAALLGLLIFISVPTWLPRADYTQLAREARRVFAPPEWQGLIRWMRSRTSTSDAFIAADSPALSIVGATGRKVVALDRFFANPYVDVQPRLVARQLYWDALASGDCASARRLAQRYQASYVIHARSPEVSPGACGLETVFEIRGVRVDRIRN